jgi:hypothetical protein
MQGRKRFSGKIYAPVELIFDSVRVLLFCLKMQGLKKI